MADCENCKHEGRRCALVMRPVKQEYALHLAQTKGFPIKSAYLHCNHCGENFSEPAANTEELLVRIKELEEQIAAQKKVPA